MLLLKNKKGEFENTLYIYILDFVIVGAILFAALTYINNIENDTYFDKNYISKDFALLLSTFIGAPHQITHYYNPEKYTLHNFKFDFSNNRVTISNSDVSKSSDRAVYYPYASNNFYSNDLVELDGPNTIFLSFDGNSFSNSDSVITSDSTDSCYTNLETKNPKYKELKILLNPTIGNNLDWDSLDYEKNIMWNLAGYIQNSLDSKGIKEVIFSSQDLIGFAKLNQADLQSSFKDYDIILHLIPEELNSQNNEISIQFNSDSQNFIYNKKLGCTLMSNIESESKFSNLDLIINVNSVSNYDYFSRSEYSSEPLILILSISNLNLAKTDSIFNTNHLSRLGYIISNSIVDYYD
jgi:hypothetical protein